jgi:hypothetical protein
LATLLAEGDYGDVIGHVQEYLHARLTVAGKDEDLLRQLASDIGELTRKLPADLRTGVEDAALKAATLEAVSSQDDEMIQTFAADRADD